MPAGIGVDLGAVQRHRAHLEHAHLAGQQKHLDEQRLDLLEEAAAECGNGVVVGVLVRRDKAERHRIVGSPLQLAAGKHPGGVAVDQKAQQHGRVVGCRPRAAIAFAHRGQIHPVDNLHHEAGQVSLRQPFIDRRRHQEAG